jgi:hypothetical protein
MEHMRPTERFANKTFSANTSESFALMELYRLAKISEKLQDVVYSDLLIYHSQQTSEYISSTRSLTELNYDKYRLNTHSGISLLVELEYEAPHFIAYNETFGIYGSGDTEESAIKDFEQSFIEFYLMITDCSPEKLGRSTLEFRKTLETFATLIIND